MSETPLTVVRRALRAYVDKDCAAIEAVISADYHFTSPIDNRLDRSTYFSRCWPNSEHTQAFQEICAYEAGDTIVSRVAGCFFPGRGRTSIRSTPRPPPIFVRCQARMPRSAGIRT